MKEKKKIALLDWDMTVTGGVEAVAASLTKTLSEIYDIYFMWPFRPCFSAKRNLYIATTAPL